MNTSRICGFENFEEGGKPEPRIGSNEGGADGGVVPGQGAGRDTPSSRGNNVPATTSAAKRLHEQGYVAVPSQTEVTVQESADADDDAAMTNPEQGKAQKAKVDEIYEAGHISDPGDKPKKKSRSQKKKEDDEKKSAQRSSIR